MRDSEIGYVSCFELVGFIFIFKMFSEREIVMARGFGSQASPRRLSPGDGKISSKSPLTIHKSFDERLVDRFPSDVSSFAFVPDSAR